MSLNWLFRVLKPFEKFVLIDCERQLAINQLTNQWMADRPTMNRSINQQSAQSLYFKAANCYVPSLYILHVPFLGWKFKKNGISCHSFGFTNLFWNPCFQLTVLEVCFLLLSFISCCLLPSFDLHCFTCLLGCFQFLYGNRVSPSCCTVLESCLLVSDLISRVPKSKSIKSIFPLCFFVCPSGLIFLFWMFDGCIWILCIL